jgi:hypothetical protein
MQDDDESMAAAAVASMQDDGESMAAAAVAIDARRRGVYGGCRPRCRTLVSRWRRQRSPSMQEAGVSMVAEVARRGDVDVGALRL